MDIDIITQRIAWATHGVNRAIQTELGEEVDPPWDELADDDWRRQSSLESAQALLEGSHGTPMEEHERWMAERLAAGWVWGPFRDTERKTNPSLVPYEELPPEVRVKDAVRLAVASLLLELEGP